MSSVSLRRLAFVSVLAAVLLAAGCGKSSTTTSTTSTTDWANSLCTAITTWKASVTSAVDSVKSGNISKSSLQTAAKQVETSTQTFADTVKGLGKPDTQAGDQAKKSLDQLSTQIDDGLKQIDDAVSGATSVSGIISAAPVVLNTLKSMGSDVTTTYNQLQSLDASGELTDAFNQASACKTLNKSS
jgi:hypothetical protein